jgi:prepilin-type N-terminal cleavage/methylation domain-containing protein
VKRSIKGLTLIELLVAVNVAAILAGVASVYYAEFGNEARYTEIYQVFPRIIRSQGIYAIQHDGYYTAPDHDALRVRGIDLSEVQYFDYSTFHDEFSSFSIRAEAGDWAPGGWVLFNMKQNPQWTADGVMIRTEWLPE